MTCNSLRTHTVSHRFIRLCLQSITTPSMSWHHFRTTPLKKISSSKAIRRWPNYDLPPSPDTGSSQQIHRTEPELWSSMMLTLHKDCRIGRQSKDDPTMTCNSLRTHTVSHRFTRLCLQFIASPEVLFSKAMDSDMDSTSINWLVTLFLNPDLMTFWRLFWVVI